MQIATIPLPYNRRRFLEELPANHAKEHSFTPPDSFATAVGWMRSVLIGSTKGL